MYTAQSKKISIIAILDILNKYSDEDHKLTAQKIIELLRDKYDLKIDRKAVKRSLMELVDFDNNRFDIEYSETLKKNPKGEEETIYSDWYIRHKFDSSELRLLIDSLLFSKHIPYSQCKDLIKKLTELSSEYFNAKVNHVHNLPESLPRNPELFYTIEILDEAIQKKKQVSFNYTEYGIDLQKRLTERDGEPINYLINPYQMVATNGRYYLVCNLDKYDDLANYRVDRISNIKLLKTNAKAIKNVKGGRNGLNLPKHMAEHIYMYSGEGVRVKFIARRRTISDLVDWFGKDISVVEKDENTIEVSVTVNEDAMFNWALQYGSAVEVLSPKSLRDRLKETSAEMAKRYAKP